MTQHNPALFRTDSFAGDRYILRLGRTDATAEIMRACVLVYCGGEMQRLSDERFCSLLGETSTTVVCFEPSPYRPLRCDCCGGTGSKDRLDLREYDGETYCRRCRREGWHIPSRPAHCDSRYAAIDEANDR